MVTTTTTTQQKTQPQQQSLQASLVHHSAKEDEGQLLLPLPPPLPVPSLPTALADPRSLAEVSAAWDPSPQFLQAQFLHQQQVYHTLQQQMAGHVVPGESLLLPPSFVLPQQQQQQQQVHQQQQQQLQQLQLQQNPSLDSLPALPSTTQQQSYDSGSYPAFRPAYFYPSSALFSSGLGGRMLINNQQAPPPAPKKPSISTPRLKIAENLYEAMYSNIAVYELDINDVSVMRRKSDSWINGTHILKAAQIDKGRRTKILEKEVHGEPHEKIQGGFGRYQGTWYVSLCDFCFSMLFQSFPMQFFVASLFFTASLVSSLFLRFLGDSPLCNAIN
jgi:hypothetical protein